MKKLFIALFAVLTFLANGKTLNEIIDDTIRYNNWAQAKTELEEYTRANPTDPAGFSYYSIALSQLKLYPEAIKAGRMAVNCETNDEKKGEYYYNLGSYYYGSNITDVAVSMYQKAIELNRMLAAPYYMLGLISFEKKSYDECIQYWTTYISLCEDSVKKSKVEQAISKMQKFQEQERERIAEQQRAEEEAKKRREEYLKNLKDELSDSNGKEGKNLSDYKINESEDEAEFEGLD